MAELKINKGRFLPLWLRITSSIIVFILFYQMALMESSFYQIPLLIILSLFYPFIWFSYNIITIKKGEIIHAIWVMGLKIEKSQKFNSHIITQEINHIQFSLDENHSYQFYIGKSLEERIKIEEKIESILRK